MERSLLEGILEETSGFQLTFQPTRRVQSMRIGDWESSYPGSGYEPEDLREYQVGEDVRDIHARASERFDKDIIIKRNEPREARLIILFDVSPYMHLRDKMTRAFTAASILMHSAFSAHMPLGLWVVGSKRDIEIRPKMGEEQFYAVSETLTNIVCGRTAEHWGVESEFALEDLRTYLSRGSFLFPISDFLGLSDDDLVPTVLRETEGFDAIPVIVQDELEFTFPENFSRYGASVPLYDVKTRAMQSVWMSPGSARLMRVRHEERFRRLCYRFEEKGLSYVHLPTSVPMDIFTKLQQAL